MRIQDTGGRRLSDQFNSLIECLTKERKRQGPQPKIEGRKNKLAGTEIPAQKKNMHTRKEQFGVHIHIRIHIKQRVNKKERTPVPSPCDVEQRPTSTHVSGSRKGKEGPWDTRIRLRQVPG